ncbi:hypothetical protein LCGC14_0552130 [marine sediment metagenome]|uniref:Uncharacterized protein n=1 Tax=marine sediment metagenome TaxID=412755 RepID=A0A0F9RPF2_9ZZZZ
MKLHTTQTVYRLNAFGLRIIGGLAVRTALVWLDYISGVKGAPSVVTFATMAQVLAGCSCDFKLPKPPGGIITVTQQEGNGI